MTIQVIYTKGKEVRLIKFRDYETFGIWMVKHFKIIKVIDVGIEDCLNLEYLK